MNGYAPASPPTTGGRPTSEAKGAAILALVTPLALIVWLPLMFVLAYWVTDLTNTYPTPGADQTLWEIGPIGWATAVVFAIVTALPCLVGVRIARDARRRGAGVLAVTALWLNAVLAAALIAWTLIG
jgi:hypothetical protein